MSPTERYTCIPIDAVSKLDRAGCSDRDDLHVYFGIWTNPAKRSVAGLIHLGVEGLAESLGDKGQEVRAALDRLTKAGLIVCDFSRDVRPGLIYVIGAAAADPPSTPNAVIAAARQLNELPASPVAAAVCHDLDSSISRKKDCGNRRHGKKSRETSERASLFEQWQGLTANAPWRRPSVLDACASAARCDESLHAPSEAASESRRSDLPTPRSEAATDTTTDTTSNSDEACAARLHARPDYARLAHLAHETLNRFNGPRTMAEDDLRRRVMNAGIECTPTESRVLLSIAKKTREQHYQSGKALMVASAPQRHSA